METTLQTALAFFKRDFLIAASYKAAFAADALGIVFRVITFYYIGAVFGDVAMPSLAASGHTYFAFLIVGIALMDFVHTSLETFATSIRDSQTTGTLEAVLLSPIRLAQMVTFSSLWPYAFTACRFVTYLLVGGVLFGLQIAPAGILPGTIILLLTILCFAPLGIVSAAVIMVFKRGTWFQTLVNGLSFLLAGIAYPVDVLPPWAAKVSYFLPLTHSVNAARGSLLDGRGLMELRSDVIYLALFALLLLPVSLWLFNLSVKRTKQLGTLTQY
jgi:ABC-2 type transport system permease protein